MRQLLFIALVALLLTGCAGLQGSVGSPPTVEAISANSALAGGCFNVGGIWGTAKTTFVKIDEGSEVNGTVEIDPITCAIKITNDTGKPTVRRLPSRPPPP